MAFSSGEYVKALPVDWTDKVCTYLEAEDLLNLSASNTFWRNAVNRNSIWKPLCVKYFNVSSSAKPIIDRKCRVEPAFKIVHNSSPNLSDICSWRIRYAQEIHIINNWIQQRYHADERSVPLPWRGFILENSLIFTDYDEDTHKYGIWNLNNDIITHYDQVDALYSFRNGFLACYNNIISYYALKEDVFELKIRTVREKALHPEIPLLADDSTLQNYKKTYFFNRTTQNERYFILCREKNSGTIVVWDFKNLNTFSFDLSSFTSLAAVETQDYELFVGESSVLFLKLQSLTSDGFPLFILNIQNSTIVLLYKYHFEYDFPSEIVGDSLALLNRDQIQFVGMNGIIRNVVISNVNTLINCRSFYCGLTYDRGGSYQVFLIEKKSFSLQVIQRFKGSTMLILDLYLKRGIHDFVFIKDPLHQRTELINLKKLKIMKLDEDFDTGAFKSNKIINHRRNVLHFW